MNNKRILFLAIAILFCGVASAKPVEPATACDVARRILKDADLNAIRLTPELYLVAPADGIGYVIVAADDCVVPVLAYSEDETFVADGMPAHIQEWIDGYSREIASHIAAGTAQSDEVAALWQGRTSAPKEPASAVSPLTRTRWNQNPYYNNLCPSNSSGQAVAGCVATATAQVMRYWNHPLRGHSSHTYSCPPFGSLSANFETDYQWPRMPNTLGWGSTSAQVNAVATLIYHVGVAVEMSYGVSSSGAHVLSYGGASYPCTENALKAYFRYSPRLHGIYKYQYTDFEWDSIIMNEISHGRPVLYTGNDGSTGHAFVVDGYRSENHATTGVRLFHINWGWGGHNDGYYTLDNLVPGSGGAGGGSYVFNYGNTALVGVEPAYNSMGENVVVVNVGSTDSTMGYVEGGGIYTAYADTIRIVAVANPGYRFLRWTSGSSANPVEFVTSGDYIDTAIFEPIVGDTLGYSNGIVIGPILTNQSDTTEWAICLPASLRSSQRSITGVQVYPYGSGRYFINVYQGDTIMPSTRIHSHYTYINGQEWQTVLFDSAVAVDNTRPLWVALRNNGNDYIYPLGYSPYSGNSDGSWIRHNHRWTNKTHYATWPVRAILEERSQRQCAVAVDRKYFVDTVEVELPSECSVTGEGIFDEGATATVSATAGGGMHFWYWVTPYADTVYDNPHTFSVDYPVTYIAVFAPYGLSVDDVTAERIGVHVSGRTVSVDVPEDAEVRAYDMQGRQVAAGRRFRLPSAGVYIVRAGAAVKKIVVL